MSENEGVGFVEGGLVIPDTLTVKVCLGMLLLELFIFVKVIEFSIELKLQTGDDAKLVPAIEAQEVELAIVSIEGKVILKLPEEVMGSAMVIKKS